MAIHILVFLFIVQFWEMCNLVLNVPAFTYSDFFQCSVLLEAKMCEFRCFIIFFLSLFFTMALSLIETN